MSSTTFLMCCNPKYQPPSPLKDGPTSPLASSSPIRNRAGEKEPRDDDHDRNDFCSSTLALFNGLGVFASQRFLRHSYPSINWAKFLCDRSTAYRYLIQYHMLRDDCEMQIQACRITTRSCHWFKMHERIRQSSHVVQGWL